METNIGWLDQLTSDEIRELFHIDKDRFMRPLSSVGKEIFRCMAAYGKTYSKDGIWAAAQEIYADYPSLLDAARKTIWGN